MTESRMLLNGKKGLILGVANKRSLAWGIARAAHREGARLALTYQGERLRGSVEDLATQLTEPLVLPCDVTSDADLDRCVAQVGETFGQIDFVVHGVAFAKREELEGRYVDTSREGFEIALDISAYSMTALARRVEPWMKNGGALLTLTYLGGDRVIPHYNVMGVAKAALECSVRYLAVDLGPKNIRVNALSAGPVRTLAASGISDFPKMLEVVKERSPLQRNIDLDDVGDAAVFFLSDLSRAITGEVIFVDAGFHNMGL
jgi:enoyl-[acyl-carrier protein] reductase I